MLGDHLDTQRHFAWAVRAALGLATLAFAAGCATGPDYVGDNSRRASSADQCVPYARLHSGINIYGDAYTWWSQAQHRYGRQSDPRKGAVMVLAGYAGPSRGHLAVVRRIVSRREIRIDHANWFEDGTIYVNNPVQDVSEENDWTRVRIWNMRTGAWGGNVYNVQGFILAKNNPI